MNVEPITIKIRLKFCHNISCFENVIKGHPQPTTTKRNLEQACGIKPRNWPFPQGWHQHHQHWFSWTSPLISCHRSGYQKTQMLCRWLEQPAWQDHHRRTSSLCFGRANRHPTLLGQRPCRTPCACGTCEWTWRQMGLGVPSHCCYQIAWKP